MSAYLLIGAAVAAVAVFFLLSSRIKGARRRAMSRVSEETLVDLEEYGPGAGILKESGLPFFMEGRSGVGRLLFRMPPEDGMQAFYFDHHATLGSGGAARQRACTVALFCSPRAGFPEFHLSAGGEAPDEALGLEAVDIAEFGDMPEGIKLYGRDKAALKGFFTRDIAYSVKEHPGWSAQGAGKWLLVYKDCSLVSPGEYRDFMAEAKKLALNLS
ncbi:MAG: hypothetical protein FD189_873 [Elusimicrobia bacterium]|nr:MAG: hypothetical protein FD154_952 [Elusimicrobiota bacterium]KAF0156733.1 MAG: hypothetical protein FD189_873 [Elusimicrobiota bacterium]